jgi:hypothetical protein
LTEHEKNSDCFIACECAGWLQQRNGYVEPASFDKFRQYEQVNSSAERIGPRIGGGRLAAIRLRTLNGAQFFFGFQSWISGRFLILFAICAIVFHSALHDETAGPCLL